MNRAKKPKEVTVSTNEKKKCRQKQRSGGIARGYFVAKKRNKMKKMEGVKDQIGVFIPGTIKIYATGLEKAA